MQLRSNTFVMSSKAPGDERKRSRSDDKGPLGVGDRRAATKCGSKAGMQ
jgi:hypothetical protein